MNGVERVLGVIGGIACVTVGVGLLVSRRLREWYARDNAAQSREWHRLLGRFHLGRRIWEQEQPWRDVAPLFGVFAIALGLFLIFGPSCLPPRP